MKRGVLPIIVTHHVTSFLFEATLRGHAYSREISLFQHTSPLTHLVHQRHPSQSGKEVDSTQHHGNGEPRDTNVAEDIHRVVPEIEDVDLNYTITFRTL